MRQCSFCHKEVPEDSAFCPFCGRKQDEQVTCPHCGVKTGRAVISVPAAGMLSR